jgi:hypothetical protein
MEFVPRYSPSFFPLFSFSLLVRQPLARLLFTGMGATMLARLPFQLGLGRVWTPSLSSGLLGPFVLLSVLGCYLPFVWFGSLYCIFGYFDSWSLRGYIIYSFVGFIVNLCNYCYSIPPASRARCDVHEALGGAFPKRHRVDCGVSAMICKVAILRRHRFLPSSLPFTDCYSGMTWVYLVKNNYHVFFSSLFRIFCLFNCLMRFINDIVGS